MNGNVRGEQMTLEYVTCARLNFDTLKIVVKGSVLGHVPVNTPAINYRKNIHQWGDVL